MTEIIISLSLTEFVGHLNDNKGAFIIKFGAEWCVPCKKIDGLVKELMQKLPNNVTSAIIDVDDNIDIYAMFKRKKMINGIPAIFAFKQGNLTAVPDDVVVGADENQIRLFFQKYM
jgi:thioredoxin 1